MVNWFKKDKKDAPEAASSPIHDAAGMSSSEGTNTEKKSFSSKMKSTFCCGCSSGSVKDPQLIKHSDNRPTHSASTAEGSSTSPMTTRADSSMRDSVVTDADYEFKQGSMKTSLLADERVPQEKTSKFHLFGHGKREKQHLRT